MNVGHSLDIVLMVDREKNTTGHNIKRNRKERINRQLLNINFPSSISGRK